MRNTRWSLRKNKYGDLEYGKAGWNGGCVPSFEEAIERIDRLIRFESRLAMAA